MNCVCMLYACCMPVVCILCAPLCACCMRAVRAMYDFCMGSIYVACMLYAFGRHAVCMMYASCLHFVCMLYALCMHDICI